MSQRKKKQAKQRKEQRRLRAKQQAELQIRAKKQQEKKARKLAQARKQEKKKKYLHIAPKPERQKPKKLPRKQKKRQKKQEAARELYIPSAADAILDNYLRVLAQWQPPTHWLAYTREVHEEYVTMLSRAMDQAIQTLGRDTVAANIERNAQRFYESVQSILYGSSDLEQLDIDLAVCMDILWGR